LPQIVGPIRLHRLVPVASDSLAAMRTKSRGQQGSRRQGAENTTRLLSC
jgi:hypothetical protein